MTPRRIVVKTAAKLTKNDIRELRDILIRALGGDPRISDAAKMQAIRNVVTVMDNQPPATYEELFEWAEKSGALPRKKGYAPDLKRLFLQKTAEVLGVPVEEMRVLHRGRELRPLAPEWDVERMRESFVAPARSPDNSPILRILGGVK